MSSAHAQVLRLRLFLEGVEVPVIGAQVQCSPNSPAVATIQLPPLAEATRFKPRTTVHLFFLDLYKGNAIVDKTGPHDGEQRGERNPSLTERTLDRKDENDTASLAANKDLRNHNWKLLFGGEVVGFTWNKTPGQRSVILQCEDWSNYWDYAFQADNTGIFGPGLKAVFSGANTSLFTDFLESEGSVLTRIISSGKCNTFPQLKGLAAGIVRLIEAVGGTYYVFPTSSKAQPPKLRAGQNIFFSYNELRLHLTQLIGTLENDPTSERILRYQGYSGMFNRILGGQGQQVSIRKAITALTRLMFYEMYPQSCPKYKPGTYGEVSGVRRVKLKDHPTYGQFATVAEETIASLQDAAEALTQSTSTLGTVEGAEQFSSIVTQEEERLKGIQKRLRQTRAQMRGVPEPAPKSFSAATNAVSRALIAVSSLRSIRGGSQSARSRAARVQTAFDSIQTATQQLAFVNNAVVLLGSSADRHPAQLYQQVFKPDCWFSAPPRCNVLFPELYDNLSYQRMFLQEPTRFMLKTNDEFFGEDFLFDKFYFAPQAGTIKGQQGTLAGMLRRDLLEHERFTGILPIFEKMGEFNVFASKAENGTRHGLQKIGLAQRSANFIYFRHRFNARRMTVEGKFNPYVAVGFPGLIIDKYVDRETIQRHNDIARALNAQNPDGSMQLPQLDTGEILGTNFLGNFTQVAHQVTQQGSTGKTNITVTFPRQAEESVSFLGTIPDDIRAVRRVSDADAKKATDIAALSPPRVFSIGPNGGRVVGVADVTQQHAPRPDGAPTSRLPVFFSGARRDSAFRPPEVPIGVLVSARDIGSPVLEEVIGGTQQVVFKAYRVTEEVPRFRMEKVLLPAEEYIRPGWYGDVWTNSRVGEVYRELIDTGAITDPHVVNDFGRSSTQFHSEDAQRALEDRSKATDVDDARKDAPALVSLEEGSSIQQAVEFLLLTYSYTRQAGIDVDEFIGAYTWRPIASMLDLFGTSDLQYSPDGEQIVGGMEGFHSRAIGPYNNLFGLVSAEIEDVVGIKRGSVAASNIDTRKEKRDQIERYMAQLLFSNAILG